MPSLLSRCNIHFTHIVFTLCEERTIIWEVSWEIHLHIAFEFRLFAIRMPINRTALFFYTCKPSHILLVCWRASEGIWEVFIKAQRKYVFFLLFGGLQVDSISDSFFPAWLAHRFTFTVFRFFLFLLGFIIGNFN